MQAMPSSDLAYKALYTALDTRSRGLQRPHPQRPDTMAPQLHDDVFVETSGPTSAVVYMFIVRSTSTLLGAEPMLHRYGVFANVDKRAASAPRVDTIATADVAAFLAALPPIALCADPSGDQAAGGMTFEVRVRNAHVDLTMHFANPRPPRGDLIALGCAIRELVTLQTS
jgi:hypothetical protein